MSVMQCLNETYDNAIKANDDGGPLPLSHSTQNAHLEVEVNEKGNFVQASYVEKNSAETIIPVTEKSASRTNGVIPHPLFDKLQYIAGDYKQYCDDDNSDYHKAYMEQLKKWVDSSYGDAKLSAIYNYLSKGTIIKDLIQAKIFSLTADGKLTEKWEYCQVALSIGKQADAFVRFRVSGIDDVTALWQDKNIIKKYSEYYLSQDVDPAFCYITGENGRRCINHPNKIRNSGDKAKIISSNDSSGFTYRGRFKDPEEAFSMSYKASQKVHSALRWLIAKQGAHVGNKVFVLWSVDNQQTPNLFTSTYGFATGNSNETLNTGEEIAKAFNKAILGYRGNITNYSKIILLGLDAATTGRMSIIFSREYYGKQGNELIDNIANWHESAAWCIKAKTKDNSIVYYNGVPAPYEIAKFAYGTDQNGLIKCNDDKILSNGVERILPCICDGKRIPRDIVNRLIEKAIHPQNYSAGNWQSIMACACAMYRKYMYDYNGEVIELSVDKNSGDISYNLGRLLAVFDAIENYAKYIRNGKEEKKSETNAMRFFTRFTQKPNETYLLLYQKIIPYREQLERTGKGGWYYELLGEISEKIDPDELRNAKVDGAFCIGFDSQRLDIINRNKNIANNTNKEEA